MEFRYMRSNPDMSISKWDRELVRYTDNTIYKKATYKVICNLHPRPQCTHASGALLAEICRPPEL